MAKLIVLGTASAVPAPDHENTHFVLKGEIESVLVDCVGSDIYRLGQVGVNLENLNNIILTHCHPDHVSGIPPLLMSLWLMGRTKPLNLYGLDHTLTCIEKMMEIYEWHNWPKFFPVNFHRLPEEELTPVLETADFRIFASPVCHIIPTIGLRMEARHSDVVMAYSCDTEPCTQVVGLGNGAEILIHESTGESYGHSSAAQAGEIARKAGAKTLYLIHYPPNLFQNPGMIAQAQAHFQGEVCFAEDLMELAF